LRAKTSRLARPRGTMLASKYSLPIRMPRRSGKGLFTVLVRDRGGSFLRFYCLRNIHMNVEARPERRLWASPQPFAHRAVPAMIQVATDSGSGSAINLRLRRLRGWRRWQSALSGQAERRRTGFMPGLRSANRAARHIGSPYDGLRSRCSANGPLAFSPIARARMNRVALGGSRIGRARASRLTAR